MGRIGPADLEQILGPGGVVLGRDQEAPLVFGMNPHLLAGQETGANPGPGGAQCQRGGEAPAIGDPARRDNGNIAHRIDHGGDQRHRRHRAAHMAARLPALRDDDIDAAIDGAARIRRVGHGMQHGGARRLDNRHQLRRVRPEEGDDFHALLQTHRQTFLLREADIQVHREGARCQCLGGADIAAQCIDVHAPERQHAQPAGIADRGGEFRAMRPAQGGEDDGNVDSEFVAKCGSHAIPP